MSDLIIQAIGFIALLLVVVSFQMNNNKSILTIHIISSLLFSIHFFCLGAITGALLNIVLVARNLVFSSREKAWANHHGWLFFFWFLFALSAVFTWNGAISLLPTIAVIFTTTGFWLNKAKTTRIAHLLAGPCWLLYNFISGSIPGCINEIFVLVSVIIGMYRFDLFRKVKKVP